MKSEEKRVKSEMIKMMSRWVAVCLLVGMVVGVAKGIDQAMPSKAVDPHAGLRMPGMGGGMAPAAPAPAVAEDRTEFKKALDLKEFRLLAIQHRDQVKIMDSWARQSLTTIRNRSSINGDDPLYTALDIAFRPEAWDDKNIIYVQAIPIREQLTRFAGNEAEASRILHEGLVSPQFVERQDVGQLLDQLGSDTKLLSSVNKIKIALETYHVLWQTMQLVPPAKEERGTPWRLPLELRANYPEGQEDMARAGMKDMAPVPGYSAEESRTLWLAYRGLARGWAMGDASLVNSAMATFVADLPKVDPDGYPSAAKRTTELWYNRTFFGTVFNVFLYFGSMTLFLLMAVGVSDKLWKKAYGLFTVAVILHLVSMGIRMWLAGRWPTQNQFESVLGAALLGCVVGWLLETWKKNGLFGMAFSFVGFLAMTACMAAPYMFGNDLGGAISKTAGILQTYWLYIHVNIVISSYALISATFILGAVYLIVKLWHWINPLEPGADAAEQLGDSPAGPVGTVKQVLRESIKHEEAQRMAVLATLDQANMVILQMAFWFLGIGIVCGAVWADHSWGRPWGWDPKETFALVTWIVYLIIVHVRLVVPKLKADATSWMSIAGFGIMMFNWIGVNYFLAGLHSYA